MKDCVRYVRVHQHPLVVDATVTSHDVDYDSEGDTYYSYVSYHIDGTDYSGIRYQSTSSESKLKPIGSKVNVEVNPERRNELMDDIANPFSTATMGVMLCMLGAYSVSRLRILRLTEEMRGSVDHETAARDAKTAIRSRGVCVFWLGFSSILWMLVLRFPMLFGVGYQIAACVSTVFWLCCMYATIRDYSYVNREEFSIRRDRLVDKTEMDSEDSTSYYLHYANSEGETRKKTTTYKMYHSAQIGDVVQSVCLHDQKRPVVHYTADGMAHT